MKTTEHTAGYGKVDAMNCEHFFFVGGGRIARILLAGWNRVGRLPQEFVVVEPDPVAAERLTNLYPQARLCRNPAEHVRDATVVFLAVHPPQVLSSAETISSYLADNTLVVSLAPKVTIAQLTARLPANCCVARVLPNAASLIGKGFNPFALGGNWDQPARVRLRQLLQDLGECPEVAEKDLETYAILTAMGPTYFWFQWQHLRALAMELGLAEKDASRATAAMLQGATGLLFDAGLSYEAAVDLVPVRPLRDDEESIGKLLTDRLLATYQKIKPG